MVLRNFVSISRRQEKLKDGGMHGATVNMKFQSDHFRLHLAFLQLTKVWIKYYNWDDKLLANTTTLPTRSIIVNYDCSVTYDISHVQFFAARRNYL